MGSLGSSRGSLAGALGFVPNHSPVRVAWPAFAAAGELALELGAGEACPARKSETTARIAEEGSSDDSNGGPEGSWRPDRFRLV